MRLDKGTAPIYIVVAMLFIIAIVVIGVIGAVMGGKRLSGERPHNESLEILSDSYIDVRNKTLTLHIKNAGDTDAVIFKVEILGTSDSISTTATVPAGESATIKIHLKDNYTSGITYTVKVYTRSGNLYVAQVKAK